MCKRYRVELIVMMWPDCELLWWEPRLRIVNFPLIKSTAKFTKFPSPSIQWGSVQDNIGGKIMRKSNEIGKEKAHNVVFVNTSFRLWEDWGSGAVILVVGNYYCETQRGMY